jgi:hypothetical protein
MLIQPPELVLCVGHAQMRRSLPARYRLDIVAGSADAVLMGGYWIETYNGHDDRVCSYAVVRCSAARTYITYESEAEIIER